MRTKVNTMLMNAVKRHGAKAALALAVGWSAFTIFNFLTVKGLGEGIEIKNSEDVTIVIIASTGSALYDVEPFCNDPLTKVTPSVSQRGAAEGYQLERIRDGKQEAVIWNGLTQGATHFYWEGAPPEQKEQPAFVSDEAKECIEEKARP